MAIATSRRKGICYGTILKNHNSSAAKKISDIKWTDLAVNERNKSNDYCVIVGNTLFTYQDANAFSRGDFPTSEVKIVGASAWNPPSFDDTSSSPTFQIVTYAGTHIYCTASTLADRDMWLSALHSGLEASYALFHETLRTGKMDAIKLSPDTRLLVPPIPRLKSNNLNSSESLLENVETISTTHCISCGRFPPENMIKQQCIPLPQYGLESRSDVCVDCLNAQGVVLHVSWMCGLYASHAHERAALVAARDAAVQAVLRVIGHDKSRLRESISDTQLSQHESSNFNEKCSNDMTDSWMPVNGTDSSWHHVNPSDAGTKALLALIKTPGFGTFRRRSRVLEQECRRLEQGTIGDSVEFIDILTEKVSAVAGDTSNAGSEDLVKLGITQTPLSLKKEAFKVAGDMSAAIKLLNDHAIPSRNSSGSVEMLACILEFLLDLCEEGELPSIAFFWPQLRQIYLCMLPATDSDGLIRIELVEDFLITVATRHSVHLALELVWGLLADLEEGMDESTTDIACRARRFAVLRFVCELESILFDFDGGWGGGSISLQGMLAPSNHQAQIIKDAINVLQLHRMYSGYHLTRSVRLEKLQSEANEKRTENEVEDDDSAPFVDFPEEELTTNVSKSFKSPKKGQGELSAADYFSAQLSFASKLGSIAAKLFPMEPEDREAELMKELDHMNSSRRLGGDPLSRAGEGISRVVHIPGKESHVFRSKERTPVLLLLEVNRPNNAEEDVKKTDNDGTKNSEDAVINKEEKTEPDNEENNEINSSVESTDERDLVASTKSTESFTLNESSLKSPIIRKLKKFDSSTGYEPVSPVPTSDKEMENLVADAVKKGLTNQLDLPITTPSHSNTEPVTPKTIPSEGDNILSDGTKEIDNERNLSKSTKSASNKIIQKPFSRMSPFGSIGKASNSSDKKDKFQPAPLAAFGEGRREVLTTILATGMRGNVIAKGAAAAAQKAVQVMDRQRAMKLIMNDGETNVPNKHEQGVSNEDNDTFSTKNSEENYSSEDDEVMEALRILLIQNRVTKGKITPEAAVKMISPGSNNPSAPHESGTNDTDLVKVQNDMTALKISIDVKSASEYVDAGDIDSRLSGCGPLNSALQAAINLWKDGVISNGELLDLVKKDLNFFIHSALPSATNIGHIIDDSAFWVRFAFGERWAERKARLATASNYGDNPRWDLVGIIVKSNDDLRQEAFVMQLIELCCEAFEVAGLELWVQPYRILATGRTTGVIETVKNAMSLDSLKKRPGYANGMLKGHFKRMAEFAKDPEVAFKNAQRNFVRSLAAYSLISYFFMVKDRHNGNLLVDTAGHVIHIDFGFVFGIAPGGSFSLEMSTPFKFTDEMLDVMDGLGSPLFSEFVTLFCCGFLALQSHVDTFCTLVEVTSIGSTFKCFLGKDTDEIIDKFRERFRPNCDKATTVSYALELVKQATSSFGTKQYDFFQYMSQGIAA